MKLKSDYPIKPIPSQEVELNDDYWSYRIKTNHEITIPHVFKKCEVTKRIQHFQRAAGQVEGKKPLKYPFDDSDVFKAIEGAARALKLRSDADLEGYIDNLIDIIAEAQEEDGYLYTHRTIDPENPPLIAGKERWESVSVFSHELYNVGHLYESAVAYFEATGKRKLLDVALKNVELVLSTFGPGKNESPPGHQEIELGLISLYRLTGDDKFLNLAKFFLDIRGDKSRKGYEKYVEQTKSSLPWEGEKRFEYNQTHAKVTEQEEATGHAVRATYMYAAMTDIIALTKDKSYLPALEKIWDNVVSKKIYITGGVGNEPVGEAFGDNYKLPNLNCYNETCAAIGNIFWNHRMFLLLGDSKYIDVLEKTLYNGLLSGYSLDGNRFFYTNPLASEGNFTRKKWFVCACCPPNITRSIPAVPSYIYAIENSTIYVNLFISSMVKIPISEEEITITQETNYPWDGNVKFSINISKNMECAIAIRIPGWTQNNPMPGNLYRYLNTSKESLSIKINGSPLEIVSEKGYILIKRVWKPGDVIEYEMPMPVRRVIAHENVEDDIGRVALERGPLVYCIEQADNDVENLNNININDTAELQSEFKPNLLNGISIITGKVNYLEHSNNDESIKKIEHNMVAIPYHLWTNRERGEMAVWILRE